REELGLSLMPREHAVGSHLIPGDDDFAEAIPSLLRAFELNEDLMRRRPGDRAARFQTSAESYLLSIAMFSKTKPDYRQAKRFGALAVELRGQLLEEDPNDHRLRERLGAALTVLGNAQLAAGDHGQAEGSFRRALALARAVEEKRRQAPGWHASQAHSHYGLAEIAKAGGNGGGACEHYRQALVYYDRLRSNRAFEKRQTLASRAAVDRCGK
ncbi:MAG: hypothetical protein JNK48_26145, partial [Bryobacterales bacterium]|nr:hypothetical protein [Bryobacterales bacterium]